MEKRTYPVLAEEVLWHQLPNGLPIAVVPRPGFTKKLAYFVTDYGAIHTEFTLNGESYSAPAGVAHFLEHKMFDLPGRDVMAEFAAMGANPNAFTSYDLTAYYFSCTDNFEACLHKGELINATRRRTLSSLLRKAMVVTVMAIAGRTSKIRFNGVGSLPKTVNTET